MTPIELIRILKEYNFMKNSVRSFSLKYKITEKTILKYLKEHKIPYNNRKIRYEMSRNCLGQYTFKSDVNKYSQNPNQLHDIKDKARTSTTQQSSSQSKSLGHLNKVRTSTIQQSSSQSKDLEHKNKKSSTGVKNLTEFTEKYVDKYFPESANLKLVSTS